MATLDIFNNNAFSVTQLSQTITDIPDVPTKLGDKGIFREYGINTTSMGIERTGSALKLVPSAPRGGVGQPATLTGRKLIPLQAVHLPQSWSVLADEVQGVRAFGSETEVDQVTALVKRKLQVVRDNLDLTLEYQRVGALKGLVLDADGSTLLDVYSAFGMTKQTQYWNTATSSSTASPKQASVNLKRALKKQLGGRSFTGTRVICSADFFDALVNHDEMKKAWELWNNGAYFREDQSGADFVFAGVSYEVYLGGTDNADFIPSGKAYAYPEGVPGMFQTAFAPADYMETVNTTGLPFYAKQEPMPMNKGVYGEAQSNPLTFNSLPEAVIELSSAASA